MRVFLLTMAFAAAATAAHAQPAATAGQWAGRVYQDGVNTPYRVTIAIDGLTGTTVYSDGVVCKGVLTAQRYANGQPYGDMYDERITENAYNARRPTAGSCISGGMVSVSPMPNGQLAFRWSIPWGDDILRVSGELDPQPAK